MEGLYADVCTSRRHVVSSSSRVGLLASVGEELGLQGETLILAPSWSPAHGWKRRALLKAFY